MNTLEDLKRQAVLVVGDMMVDKYIIGNVERISPEAPVPVLRKREEKRKLGGAGNVIANIVAMGAAVRALGRVGDDEDGAFFRGKLQELGVDDSYIFSEGSTIVKTRVTASNQQFIRIDDETVIPPSDTEISTLHTNMDALFQGINVIIISDYAKGIVSREMCSLIIDGARQRRIPVLVDPKGKDAGKYRGATAITPNNKEFLDMTGLSGLPDEEAIRCAAVKLCADNSFERLILTRSEKGISVIEGATGDKHDFPAEKKEVLDVTGAGDTVIATLALTIGAGLSVALCVKIANVAASIVISKFGAAQTSIEELSEAIYPQKKAALSEEETIEEIHRLKKTGKRIVFTNGCFDLVHAGHISSFRQARQHGDILVVGLNTDESICRIKGPTRPIVSLKDRMVLLQALECVDYVIPFDEDTPQSLIEKVEPDVLVKGKDWEGKVVVGSDFVRSHGGSVILIEMEQGLSTTNIINKIKSMSEREMKDGVVKTVEGNVQGT